MRPIYRYRTALSRSRLSQPMSLLLRHGLLRENRTIFDYGCGQGDDLVLLTNAGLSATGWDPYFRPDTKMVPSDVVNLGFVLNVIEDPLERQEALRAAWQLTQGVLAVSTMLAGQVSTSCQKAFGDGYVTSRGTFQKYYGHSELRELVRNCLGVDPVSVAPGIFLVFRDLDLREEFLFERYSNRYSGRLVLATTMQRERRVVRRPASERIEAVLREIGDLAVLRGRLPTVEEVSAASMAMLREAHVSFRHAVELCRLGTLDEQAMLESRTLRREDLLVHAASGLLRGSKVAISPGSGLGRDVRAIFATAKDFEQEARQLLFSLADATKMTACLNTAKELGKGLMDDEGRLLVANERYGEQSPEIRCYVACAAILSEVPTGPHLFRLDVRRKRVVFFHIRNAGETFPVSTSETIVDLRRQVVETLSRRRVLLRKADLHALAKRSRQRRLEAEYRAQTATEENTIFEEHPAS